MTAETFDRLCKNIGMSGMSSTITCYKRENGRFVIISGHHRFEACKKVGYKKIGVIYADEKDLTQDEIIAIQLSHNSIHGEDNKSILRRMFEQIKSIDFKQFAYVDMDEIGTVDMNGLNLVQMQTSYTFSAVFYENSRPAIEALIGDLDDIVKRNDIVFIAGSDQNEDTLFEMMTKIKKKYDIVSPSVAFAKILELAYNQLQAED